MYPYLGARVVSRIPGLAAEADIIRSHREQLDGSGYPFGVVGASLGQSERILAATVDYVSAGELRPYRDPLSPAQAVDRLRERVRLGQLDEAAVAAVVAAAGHEPIRPTLPAGLTPRESEILALVARGLSNRQIANALTLSEKTVRNQVERIYAKVGVNNRVGASLYALTNGIAALGSHEG
jgi:DNA-binding NarL/FixJ family response regulator